jgi:hypothetical protein
MTNIATSAIPRPLTYKVEGGCGQAIFGPELRDYIRTTPNNSFPILDEAGNVLHNFHITDALRAEMS